MRGFISLQSHPFTKIPKDIETAAMSDDEDLFGSSGGDTDDLIAEANKKPIAKKKLPKLAKTCLCLNPLSKQQPQKNIR